ncbi:TetR/AcrR family transcriptional regulator [Zhihengliuella halotolerans]|uniref:TetR family transcriptional regulator n=1 Tax=Zhihengliuella halotolerans TaxID=370736 RepID=A0A4Q8A8V4_9MICC|nr:TetR family transcriptional regulator C-terminal domain-containing protein [Zhihengliuella halotolerans]RZU60490.1 TetR family transcriptional regulator [Zhihengliuella halotolerans]
MPKIVDHDARREEIARAACRVVARSGLEGLTLRDVAAEIGFANGALKPYFPTKAALSQAAFSRVFRQTERRITEATRGKRATAALRAFALEVLPLDDNRLDEARVVLPFWQLAVHDPRQAEVNDQAMLSWRSSMRRWLAEGVDDGEIRSDLDPAAAVESLLNFLLGAQGAGVIDAEYNGPRQLRDQLEVQLRGFRP